LLQSLVNIDTTLGRVCDVLPPVVVGLSIMLMHSATLQQQLQQLVWPQGCCCYLAGQHLPPPSLRALLASLTVTPCTLVSVSPASMHGFGSLGCWWESLV
jgi:hypothetical protein